MANEIRTGDPVDSVKDVGQSSRKIPEFEKHLKKAGGHIGRNVVEIAIKMKTIVRKRLMVKIIKLHLRNLDNWEILLFIFYYLLNLPKLFSYYFDSTIRTSIYIHTYTLPILSHTHTDMLTSMFHSFFQFPSKVEVLILLFTFFQFYSVVSQDSNCYYYYYLLL